MLLPQRQFCLHSLSTSRENATWHGTQVNKSACLQPIIVNAKKHVTTRLKISVGRLVCVHSNQNIQKRRWLYLLHACKQSYSLTDTVSKSSYRFLPIYLFLSLSRYLFLTLSFIFTFSLSLRPRLIELCFYEKNNYIYRCILYIYIDFFNTYIQLTVRLQYQRNDLTVSFSA